ncbi:MAG: PocR ligand-binding domain-containing protein [Lachnospiraceae bacterium]|nr:PocR ligand-binding domain-containing protein [Lachnospiraceae bacterium]
MDIDHDLYLTDLIDRDVLQRIQDAFSNQAGVAALTTDRNGVPVTEGSNFTDFCTKYTRNSPVGCLRCTQCDKSGAELAYEKGKSTVYACHAGLLDFAAPIMANGKIIGCFIGGQVLTEKPDEDKIKAIAEEIDVDPEAYYEAACKVNIVEKEDMDDFASFLSTIADVLSDMAYNKYQVYQANLDLERTSNMKSDFLANMSHEIRTPMNAVIGMAEMALREDIPPAARDYIKQIKESGKALLTIINDILDFSKIESGKMDINVVDYEPMSVISDVSNIVMTRLKDKDVELILDIAPNMPNKLLGDNIRIKQVLLNISNNAAKFTNRGRILIKMDYTNESPDEIMLHVSVEDTGIGIKKEDMDKLFKSFQQVDSKRNRNIEGTGLGLAISQQLLELMEGNIWVESEYEKGSKFSFMLPQKIVDDTPSISIKEPDSIMVAGLISNQYVKDSLCEDVAKLGVEYMDMDSDADFKSMLGEKKLFFFVEKEAFFSSLETVIRNNPKITAVLLEDFFDEVEDYDIPNLLVVRKPLSILTIAMILNGDSLHLDNNEASMNEFEFVAPDANILIVDDNEVNLTVAEGLLKPLNMKVDKATSGMEAIDKISKIHYDVIFMDHMMPELDGVETTHIIRRLHPEYNDVPIIALTANAVEGTKEMFCQEGMNDFVAKPIELRILVSKLRQWLPIEKIQKVYNTHSGTPKEKETLDITVGDLDIAFALKFLGSEELFWTIVNAYYRTIDKKAKLIKSLEEQEDWPAYTIEVHALKSSSKQIGAIELSDKAAALEKAGNARDSEFIHKNTDELINQYVSYIDVLAPYCPDEEEDDAQKESIALPDLLDYFSSMKDALENLDMDQMETVIKEMNHYSYEDWQQEMFAKLKEAVEEIDVDSCEEILRDWGNRLS